MIPMFDPIRTAFRTIRVSDEYEKERQIGMNLRENPRRALGTVDGRAVEVVLGFVPADMNSPSFFSINLSIDGEDRGMFDTLSNYIKAARRFERYKSKYGLKEEE